MIYIPERTSDYILHCESIWFYPNKSWDFET